MRNKLSEKKGVHRTDVAAIVICIGLYAYLCYIARVGFAPVDESFYYAIVMRRQMGDRLLIDEWHFEQLNAFLQTIPFWLLRTLKGSTEGIILSLRYFCVGVGLILYWFFYGRLRRFGGWGLAAIALFSSFVPMTILTLNYYTMSLDGLLVVCTILFLGKEEKSPPVLIFTGIVFACVVVAEPLIAFVYFGWCLLTLIRTLSLRKGKNRFESFSFILNVRSWLYFTAGVVMTAVVFLIWLLSSSPLPEIIQTLPELMNDSEYAVADGIGTSIFQPERLIEPVRYFGILPCLGGAVVFILGIVARKKGCLPRWRRRLFITACLCFAVGFLCAGVITAVFDYLPRGYGPTMLYYYYFQNAPILFFCPVFVVLCDRFDRRLLCFWILGTAASAMIDLASDIAIGMGAAVAFLPALIAFRTVLEDIKADRAEAQKPDGRQPAKKHGRFAVQTTAALAMLSLVAWECFGLYTHAFYPMVEGIANTSNDKAITATVEHGPLKGIRTTNRINRIYEDILSDLDIIKSQTEGRVYVTQLVSYLYLYMELPIGSYYPWYVDGESETRQLRYWELHPDKRPEYIYVPDYDFLYAFYGDNPLTENWAEEKLTFLQSLCDCEITRGKAGSIVRVIRWKTD